jgi:spermidine synthase
MERLNPHLGFFYTVKKILYEGRTRFQRIQLVDTEEFGNVLLLDGITQVVEKNEFQYHEPMVHPALCAHANPRSVLVIGAGDGGILREVLKYKSIEEVYLAELDDEVVKFSRQYLTRVHQGSFDDPRVKIHIVDGRKFVQEAAGRFDVIIMDMTDPFGPSKYLYTKEFFMAVKRALRGPEGVFAMHSESPITRPAAVACIHKTLRSVFKNVTPMFLYIQMYAVLWSVAVASNKTDLARITPAVVDGRLKKRGVKGLHLYTGAAHQAMQVAYPYLQDVLSDKRARVITDAEPDFTDHFVART